jgi:hypothetical protein
VAVGKSCQILTKKGETIEKMAHLKAPVFGLPAPKATFCLMAPV